MKGIKKFDLSDKVFTGKVGKIYVGQYIKENDVKEFVEIIRKMLLIHSDWEGLNFLDNLIGKRFRKEKQKGEEFSK